jgi:hypothetical protein
VDGAAAVPVVLEAPVGLEALVEFEAPVGFEALFGLEVLGVAAVVTVVPAPPGFLLLEPQPAIVSALTAATAASAPADREN